MKTHQDRTITCEMDGCSQAFKTAGKLNTHQQEVHGMGERNIPCPHPGCDQKFFKNSHLQRHKATHSGKSWGERCVLGDRNTPVPHGLHKNPAVSQIVILLCAFLFKRAFPNTSVVVCHGYEFLFIVPVQKSNIKKPIDALQNFD